MTNPLYVSQDKWRDAVKFLMNLGCNPTLSANDQRKLRACLRGPFANGMTNEQAHRTLREAIGWEQEQVMPTYGRGFARMKARLGPEKYEALRQDTIARQEQTLSEVGKARVITERDRDSYKEYPPPKGGPAAKKRTAKRLTAELFTKLKK
jgi:hypothetical protein